MLSERTADPKTAATPAASDEKARAKRRAQARAALLRQMLRWHWISAAICLIGLLAFTITGVTLNHAADIPADTRVSEREGDLPPEARAALLSASEQQLGLPKPVRAWLGDEMDIRVPADATVEWTGGEAYVTLSGPGADAWVSLDARSGEVLYERTDRGWVAYFNDLHKGRDTGMAWRWFIDVFAAGCLVFCITGLVLLQLHSRARPSTWPLVAAGLLGPLVLALFFVH